MSVMINSAESEEQLGLLVIALKRKSIYFHVHLFSAISLQF